MKPRLLILGNGMAAARLAENLLARGHSYDITIIGGEPHGNYNRILLSNVLNGSQPADEIIMNPIEWYAQNHITLIHAWVTGVHPAKKLVTLQNARTIPYDILVFATGSRPFVPPIPGTDLYGIYTFRTLDDCTSIAKFAKTSSTVAVIGGGLLGLEAAKGLMSHVARDGGGVHVIEMAPHLMAVQLDPAGGAILTQTVTHLGVTVHTAKTTTAFLDDEHRRVRAVQFKDGSTLACDMVVISAGIRPNAELAREAGLAVERAIVVNDQLQTSAPNIYAVGECAQHRGKTYGLVAPIWDMCSVLAEVLTTPTPSTGWAQRALTPDSPAPSTGSLNVRSTGFSLPANGAAVASPAGNWTPDTGHLPAYTGSVTATKLKVMGVNVASMGERDSIAGDETIVYQDAQAGIYKKLIIRNGKLVGAILVGEIDSYNDLSAKLHSGAPLPERRSELLFPAPASNDVFFSLADLPDDKQICDCNGVCKSKITDAIKSGKATVASVGKATRAGTGCGSCKKLISGLIEAIAGEVKADPSEAWYVPAIPMDKPALRSEIEKRELKAVSQVMSALATKDCEKSKMGLAILLRAIWGQDYIDERDCRFVNDRVHGNIQKDGTFSVIPRIYGGVTTADELIKIGTVAKKYHVPTVKLTGGQRIDLLGIEKEDLPAIWKDLGMVSGYAYTKAFRTCKTCVGSEWCRFGTNDSTALGIAIEKKFQGLETPAKVKMAVSGCPRNCAESTTKDVGIIATEGGEWEIFLGGACGVSVRKGDTLTRVKSQEEAIRITARFLQYYQEHARYLERTYDFVPRIGIEKLRAILIDDSEGICAALDARIETYINATFDPWVKDPASRNDPNGDAYPGQFSSARSVALPVLT